MIILVNGATAHGCHTLVKNYDFELIGKDVFRQINCEFDKYSSLIFEQSRFKRFKNIELQKLNLFEETLISQLPFLTKKDSVVLKVFDFNLFFDDEEQMIQKIEDWKALIKGFDNAYIIVSMVLHKPSQKLIDLFDKAFFSTSKNEDFPYHELRKDLGACEYLSVGKDAKSVINISL